MLNGSVLFINHRFCACKAIAPLAALGRLTTLCLKPFIVVMFVVQSA